MSNQITEIVQSTPRTALHSSSVISAAREIGSAMAKSGMFGIKTPEQGLILAMTCVAENITPLEFMRTYHIIQGRPTMRADAMLARFQLAGGKHKIVEYAEDNCVIDFTWDGDTTTWEFSITDAKRAKLTGDNWAKFPKAMLFARCVSSGLKALCPALFHGLYVPEEIEENTQESSRPQSPRPAAETLTNSEPAAEGPPSKSDSSPYIPDPKSPPTNETLKANWRDYEQGQPVWHINRKDLGAMWEKTNNPQRAEVIRQCMEWRSKRRDAINRVKNSAAKLDEWHTKEDKEKVIEWQGKLWQAAQDISPWEMSDIPETGAGLAQLIYDAIDDHDFGEKTNERMLAIAADLEREATVKGGAK